MDVDGEPESFRVGDDGLVRADERKMETQMESTVEAGRLAVLRQSRDQKIASRSARERSSPWISPMMRIIL